MNEWVGVAIGVVLTIGTGFFVASEFALVNLDRNELESRRDRGEPRLGLTIRALTITSTHLSSAQLGITLTTLLTGYTFEPAVSSLLRGPLAAVGVPAAVIAVLGPVLAIVLATLFSMIVGELVPKNFALALPRQTAKVVIGFQTVFTTVFKPVIVLLNSTANAIIRRMGIEPKEELSGARTAEELSSLIRHSALAGLLDQGDATLLRRTLRFAERDASDVMTPRVRMSSVEVDDSAAAIVATSLATGHSRFPVIDGTPDRIVGVVHVKQAFAVPLDDRDTVTAAQLMREAVRVPESMHADALLDELRRRGLFLLVVGDEHGGTAGIVTLEDLVEEIVGELEDEHDRATTGLTRSGRSIVFDAAWRPDELLDRTGVTVPEDGDYDTVGGFVTDALGRNPELGDEVALESGVLRVDRADGTRIVRIRYIPEPEPGEPAPGEPDARATDHDRRVDALRGELS